MDPLRDRLQHALGTSYELGAELGRGGMAIVYRATDRRLRREVAIKVLPPELGYSAGLRARFVREAQTAAQLFHPNIVPIYDVGEKDGMVWFIMALVEGESVRGKVEREGQLSIGVVRRVLQEVAQALAYAHARGVVHRDVKPENILLDRGSGRPMVADFGIAKIEQEAATQVTQPGEIVGTARYMAPEQAMGEETVDGRADLYSLALVGYFMLSGKHAIEANSLPAVITMHLRGAGIAVENIGRSLPQPLVGALTRALEDEPENRYQRMEEFAEALRALGGELPDIPAPLRKLVRATERAFVTGTMAAFLIAFLGVQNIPLWIVGFVGGAVLFEWVATLGQAVNSGITWSDIRRALYVEQARRAAEVEELGLWYQRIGVAATVVVGVLIASLVLAIATTGGFGGEISGSWVNSFLFYAGTFGSVVVAHVFGIGKVAARKRSVTARPIALGVFTLVATVFGWIVRGPIAALVIASLGGGAVHVELPG